MNRLMVFAAVSALLPAATYAQSLAAIGMESKVHYASTTPAPGRYEVVQSALLARYTFMLDRATGRTWLIVKEGERPGWSQIVNHWLPKVPDSQKPRFSLFTSGFTAAQTFLVDADTGSTSALVLLSRASKRGDAVEYLAWEPFVEMSVQGSGEK